MSVISNQSRPIGFRPWEISAMVNQDVIDQHAEEAAFLWTQRERATRSPQYGLNDLAKLDARVEAHLDGLRVAGDIGWATAVAQLDEGKGEVFAASVLAFGADDSSRAGAVLEVGCSTPSLARGMISALGWLPRNLAVDRVRSLLTRPRAEIRRAGIAGMAIHRADPGRPLVEAISDPEPRLAVRAMRAAAELGRIDLLPQVKARLSDSDDACRFWAAWSSVRLGEHQSDHAFEILRAAAEAGGPLAVPALDIALRAMLLGDATLWREQLRGKASTSHLAVVASGVIGDPEAVPELIAAMEDPKFARAAGVALSMITGADLSNEHLECDSPGEDETDDPSSNSDVPWPQPAAVTIWWARRAGDYVPGIRYLCGKAMTDGCLREVLAAGRQNQRAAAAMELALRNPSEILFEHRERAQWQQNKVGRWSL